MSVAILSRHLRVLADKLPFHSHEHAKPAAWIAPWPPWIKPVLITLHVIAGLAGTHAGISEEILDGVEFDGVS